jgi:uroporphyrinogen-III synthase
MRPLVIVRPEPGASTTAAAARKLGLDTLLLPLFAIEPVEWTAPDPGQFDGLLLTSANAARFAGGQLQALGALPAYCVGEATATAAREAGLSVEAVGPGRVDRLLESLPRNLRLLHLCGIHRKQPGSSAQSIRFVPVYRAAELPVGDGFDRIAGSVVAIHSPRAGARLAELVNERQLNRETIVLAAISSEAADSAGPGWRAVEAATEPSDSALLAIAAQLCNNSDRWSRQDDTE